MLFRDGCLITRRDSSYRTCTISARALLVDAEQLQKESGFAYLLVRNDAGKPVGVVAAEEIQARLHSGSDAERRRWRQMPVESILSGTMNHGGSSSEETNVFCDSMLDCTAVSDDGSLLALFTDDDLLVSWKSVRHGLEQIMIDPVTGLPGRATLDRHLNAEFERARRCGHSFGVILVDVDHFKEINDRYGHAAGDQILSAIGQAMRSALRSYDLIARYGGDEFVVLCCGCEPREIEVPMQKLRNAVRTLALDHQIAVRPLPTLSLGACVCHQPSEISDPETVLAHADECLYLAKRAGRDCCWSVETGTHEFATHSC